jgi:hypothetical protein
MDLFSPDLIVESTRRSGRSPTRRRRRSPRRSRNARKPAGVVCIPVFGSVHATKRKRSRSRSRSPVARRRYRSTRRTSRRGRKSPVARRRSRR